MQVLQKEDKSGIIYRTWKARSPEAIVLLVHGMGAHSARWNFLGNFLMSKEISSYAIELKGFGETKTLKGHIDSLDIYYEDIIALYNIARTENPGKKVYIIGESMGALLSLVLIQKEKDICSGLICISPAFVSKMKMSVMDYIRIFSSAICFPRKQFSLPFTSSMCTRDEEYQRVMDADEREHRFATSGLLSRLACVQMRMGNIKDRINMPVLFLIAGQDKLVDPEASKKIFKRIKAEDKGIIEYPEMYHALSIEKDREKVFEDMYVWLKKRI
ncbi:MAG: alpha/beta fold hydrolase [Candidatus Aadella gelida]|nr:alpha/beta fold hydrolase [Candidatus Aadella gelida]